MNTLIIIGSGPTMQEDVGKLKGTDKKADRCAINQAAKTYKCKYWYTAHINLFDEVKCKGNPIKKSLNGRSPHDRAGIMPVTYRPGSSSLQAVYYAINKWGYDRIILCGVPLTGPNRTWKGGDLKYDRFVEVWEAVIDGIKGKVFSLSGNTKKLLGSPYEA